MPPYNGDSEEDFFERPPSFDILDYLTNTQKEEISTMIADAIPNWIASLEYEDEIINHCPLSLLKFYNYKYFLELERNSRLIHRISYLEKNRPVMEDRFLHCIKMENLNDAIFLANQLMFLYPDDFSKNFRDYTPDFKAQELQGAFSEIFEKIDHLPAWLGLKEGTIDPNAIFNALIFLNLNDKKLFEKKLFEARELVKIAMRLADKEVKKENSNPLIICGFYLSLITNDLKIDNKRFYLFPQNN